jgi:hypothetical protein
VALAVRHQQPQVIPVGQAIVGAQEGPPGAQAIVQDRRGGRRVEAALGRTQAGGGHDRQRSEPAGAEGLPLERVVGPVGEQELSVRLGPGASRLDVHDAGGALAELGRQPADDDLGALDDLAAQQLLQPILHRGGQGDVVDAEGEAREVPADVDGAVVVADDSRLGGDDVVE